MNPHMLEKVRSEELLESIRHIDHCTLRISSFAGQPCSGPIDACHLPVFGKGVGTKVTDLAAVAGCRRCHSLLDHDRLGVELTGRFPYEWMQRLLFALVETQAMLVIEGIIEVKGAKLI